MVKASTQQSQRDPDLFTVCDDHFVVTAASEAVPGEQHAGAAQAMDEGSKTVGRTGDLDIDDVGIECLTEYDVVRSRADAISDIGRQCRWNPTGHGEQDRSALNHRERPRSG